jgi:hypothetical protein
MRLDPALLDGRSSANFDTRTTTLDQLATTPTWAGQTRIIPGDPMHSLLVKLITNRGTDNPVANQMPPIASRIVDQPDTQAVIEWITKMAPPTDAGTADGGTTDGEASDAEASDAGTGDAGTGDAETNDATTPNDSGGTDATADGGATDADAGTTDAGSG